ncbi:MAG: DUF695 domain-containing protein [Deltaproteobacteria bacterium]
MKWFPFGKKRPPKVPDAWDFYPCQVDHHPASIFLNLAYADFAPIETHPTFLWIGLQILEPDDHGMGHRDDAEKLHAIEDRIAERAEKAGMLFVGRLRNNGDWQLSFYGTDEHEAQLEPLAAAGLGGEARGIHVGAKPDPEWGYFSEFLFPPEERLQWMKNRDVVLQLQQHGDVLTQPRTIDHCVVFPPGIDPGEFLENMKSKGFTSHDVGDPKGAERVFELRRDDPVELEHIHEIAMELTELVEAAGGTYDGWGCPVVTDGD